VGTTKRLGADCPRLGRCGIYAELELGVPRIVVRDDGLWSSLVVCALNRAGLRDPGTVGPGTAELQLGRQRMSCTKPRRALPISTRPSSVVVPESAPLSALCPRGCQARRRDDEDIVTSGARHLRSDAPKRGALKIVRDTSGHRAQARAMRFINRQCLPAPINSKFEIRNSKSERARLSGRAS